MTIYALSSGPGISGIAVIRISGKDTRVAINKITGKSLPKPRPARNQAKQSLLPNPNQVIRALRKRRQLLRSLQNHQKMTIVLTQKVRKVRNPANRLSLIRNRSLPTSSKRIHPSLPQMELK